MDKTTRMTVAEWETPPNGQQVQQQPLLPSQPPPKRVIYATSAPDVPPWM